MAGNSLGFCNIFHESDPSEEFDENIDIPLKPLWVPLSDHAFLCIIMTMHRPTDITSPSWVADLYFTVSDIHWRTKLSTTTLKNIYETIPPCVVPLVAHNWGT